MIEKPSLPKNLRVTSRESYKREDKGKKKWSEGDLRRSLERENTIEHFRRLYRRELLDLEIKGKLLTPTLVPKETNEQLASRPVNLILSYAHSIWRFTHDCTCNLRSCQ